MINSNQSVHPVNTERNLNIFSAGITVRAHFASMFMQGLLSSWGEHDVHNYQDMAYDSVSAADALINALNESEK